MKRCLAGLLALVSGVASLTVVAEELPQPLTLADALSHARPVPALQRADADQAAAQAGLLSADAINGTTLTANGRLFVIQPSHKSDNPDSNGSSASLTLRKRLYDFGYSDALQGAAQTQVQASQLQSLSARQEARLAVMRAFYDVLLADLEYARDNEDMAIAYIRSDRLKDRNQLGQVSDVEMLEAEADFQAVRRRQVASATRRVTSRSRLALAMGRPGELVSDLVTPKINLPDQQADDFEAYWAKVMQGNPQLQALRAQREAARQKLEAARAAHGPVLSGEFEAAVYNRPTASTYPVGGGLVLEVPLLSGGAKDADIAAAQANISDVEARLGEAQMQLREQAMQLWMERNNLRADVQAYRSMSQYRDLYLDRSRALYELEVRTDLGDAMAQISDVNLKLSGALFEWDMTQARLKALTGSLLEEEK